MVSIVEDEGVSDQNK